MPVLPLSPSLRLLDWFLFAQKLAAGDNVTIVQVLDPARHSLGSLVRNRVTLPPADVMKTFGE